MSMCSRLAFVLEHSALFISGLIMAFIIFSAYMYGLASRCRIIL
jgi:hypothetical protein